MYRSNGTGRDSYIYNNNGGFAVNRQPGSVHDSGSMHSPVKKVNRSKMSPVQNRPVHYMCDGSGRDGYIYTTHGGLTNNFQHNPGHSTFFNQLRTYERTEHKYMSRSPSQKTNSIDGSPVNPSRGVEYADLVKPDHF